MKGVTVLYFIAIIAGALADCGCLKCNPNLQVVSPRYSPCKVIYRNTAQNCPSIAPYTLQKAIPPPPPVFIPREYDYQLQVVPVRPPCGFSTYEYGLQAAVVPPPLFVPMTNLKTATERVVMDSPVCTKVGQNTCNPGVFRCPSYSRPAPLPVPVPSRYEDEEVQYRGPIIEPLCPSLHPCRYAHKFKHSNGELEYCNLHCVNKKHRRKRETSNCIGVSRHKRDLIDLPMNFVFNFIPNLLRGPILHTIHTLQHNANPAVIRARARANEHRVQSILEHSKNKQKLATNALKHKNTTSKTKKNKEGKNTNTHHSHPYHFNLHHTNPSQTNPHHTNSHHKNPHHTNPHNSNPHQTNPHNTNLHQKSPHHINPHHINPHHTNPHLSNPNQTNQHHTNPHHHTNLHHVNPHHLRKISQVIDESSQEQKPSDVRSTIQDENFKAQLHREIVGSVQKYLKNFIHEIKDSRSSDSNPPKAIILDQPENFQSPNSRDRLLEKLERFNEIHKRLRRSPLKDSAENRIQPRNYNLTNQRRKRSILLGSNEFALPFFEVDDEALDTYYNEVDKSEEIVGSKPRRKNLRQRKQKYTKSDDSDYSDEIVSSSHPKHEHPFVVLLKTPLKLLHHFNDMKKNFGPILYSFPKLLHTSKNYLRDLGKNLQIGVLDFASNVMGDFDNGVPRQYNPFKYPTRLRRSVDSPLEKKTRNKRYILKIVDEQEVEDFLKEKLGGYFGNDDKNENSGSNEEEEKSTVGSEEKSSEKKKDSRNHKKLTIKRLSPKILLDNNGKPFLEINGNKRPLFHKLKKEKSASTTHAPAKKHHKKKPDPQSNEEKQESKQDDMNDKIDEVITRAKQNLRDSEIYNLQSANLGEMPAQAVKKKISQISTGIQNLMNLDFSEYYDLYEELSKLDNLRKLTIEYWKNVMINSKTDEIHCKIIILNFFKEMQVEKDKVTEKIVKLLNGSDNFIVKKLIKLLVRLQKLQCLIQKVVDHFDNRMKVGSMSDTEKEIKFVDCLSTIFLISEKSKEEMKCSLATEKKEALRREINLLENLRLLLQKDDTYTTNEVAKQIWEMNNIEKLQQETIDEMNTKLKDNMKIRKELKILFDLLKQIETLEQACEQLLSKIDKMNIVGSKRMLFRRGKRLNDKTALKDLVKKIRMKSKPYL